MRALPGGPCKRFYLGYSQYRLAAWRSRGVAAAKPGAEGAGPLGAQPARCGSRDTLRVLCCCALAATRGLAWPCHWAVPPAEQMAAVPLAALMRAPIPAVRSAYPLPLMRGAGRGGVGYREIRFQPPLGPGRPA